VADKFSPEKRRAIMQAIRGKDTKPELVVRRLVFSLGFRYRLHDPSLPGKPDLVFKSRRKAIFVHGCYWHRHSCPRGKSFPSGSRAFWGTKFEQNKKRDAKTRRALASLGWFSLVVWECQARPSKLASLRKRLASFLSKSSED